MSVYFTISGAYLPAEAGTVILVDNGATIKSTPQVRRVAYGDGYGLDIPVAAPLRTLSAQFSNRDPAEINVIETYLINLGGDIIPDFYLGSEVVPFSTVKFNKNYLNGELFSLSAEFNEEYR
jgi:uncharacterized protein (DUF111 family)